MADALAADANEEGLALGRWGMRFARADVEADFGVWRIQHTLGAVRVGVVLAFAAWAMFLAALRAAALPEFDRAAITAVGAMAPSLGLLLAATYSRAAARWMLPGSAIANALGGFVIISIVARASPNDPQFAALIGAIAIVMCQFFGFTIQRLRPSDASVAIATYAVAYQAVVGDWYAADTIGWGTFVSSVAVVWAPFLTGLVACVSTERLSRTTYRQERIIEAQKQTIARERARSEELLKRELSHQVAERSRELGAVLAKSDVTFDVRRLSPGERFAERYRIVSALGAGGMGAVYEVERVTDGQRLALKAVVGEVSGASAARFAREAEIGARVRHANLISIVDVGVSAGVPFLAMELVRGGSLELQRSKFGDVAWALPVLRQICDGLAALHDAGVVHRDLKPGNVLLADGVAKISDFGISRFGELDEASSIDPVATTMAVSPRPRSGLVTGTGVILGTPLYMAPEAARGGRQLDASADVFALGILAYEMLTGRSPFSVPAFVLAMAEQPTPAVAPTGDVRVPAALRQLVSQALDGDPTKRPRVQAIRAAFG